MVGTGALLTVKPQFDKVQKDVKGDRVDTVFEVSQIKVKAVVVVLLQRR